MATERADDYYALLGIDAAAGAEELRSAWRRQAARWHPDRAGASGTAMFQRISAAYQVLADPATRAAYDRRRGPTRPRRDAPAVMLWRLSGHLASVLACGAARRAPDGLIELHVRDSEAAEGGMIAINMRVATRCLDCAGAPAGSCAKCAGSGTLDELFSAWLALPPEVADGTILEPSAQLPGVLRPVFFRVRRSTRR